MNASGTSARVPSLTPARALCGVMGDVIDACYLDDSRLLVRTDPYVYVVDAATGTALATMLPPHALAESVASRDGSTVAFLTERGRLSIARADRLDTAADVADERRFTHVAIDGTGRRVAATCAGAAVVVDGATRRVLAEFESASGEAAFAALALSSDGTLLLAGREDATATLWDVASSSVRFVLGAHDGAVRHVALDPSATAAATIDAMQRLRVWDARSGRCLLAYDFEARGATACAFDATGERLAILLSDGTLALLKRRSGEGLVWWQPFASLSGPALDPYFAKIAFDAAGGRVLIAGPLAAALADEIRDASPVRLLALGTQRSYEFRFAAGWMPSPSLSADGLTIVASGPKALRWEANENRGCPAGPGLSPSTDLAYAPIGRNVAVVLPDRSLCIVDDGATHAMRSVAGVRGTSAVWNADGSYIAVRTDSTPVSIAVIDTSTAAVASRIDVSSRATFLGFGRDGTLVAGDRDGFEAFAARSWRPLWSLREPVDRCAFARDSDRFFTTRDGGAVAVRDIASGDVARTIDTGERARTLAASPAGTWIVTTGTGVPTIWSVARGCVVATLDGLLEIPGLALSFSANERRVAANLGTTRDFGSGAVFDLSGVPA